MKRQFVRHLLVGLILLLLAGCGSRFGMGEPEPTATAIPVPTYTPTPVQSEPTATSAQVAEPDVVAPTATAKPPDEPGEEIILLPTPTPDTENPDATAGTTQETSPLATPGTDPLLIVSGEAVNVRGGPGTNYPVVGAAAVGDSFPLTGRNAAGDWWQVCCFDDLQGWFFAPLVDVQNEESIAVVDDIPPPVAEPESVAEEEAPTEPEPAAEAAPTEAPVSTEHSGTAGNFDPNAQYHIVGYRVIGYGENNGGIFDNGGQHMIFVNVIDAAGNGIDGAVLKDAVDDKLNVITGSKGPGRAEFEMFWDRYKLYVASDPSGDVTSQISNQMNTAYPHIPDIIGRLGPADNEYAICPTPDDRCEPPFFHAHWSYEITFQKVK